MSALEAVTYTHRTMLTNKEVGLWHVAVERINHEDNSVYYLKNALYLPAEVSMTRSVDDVDFDVLILNSCVFGEDCDTSFTLDVV